MTQRSVLDLKAFVPARNFALSRQFYPKDHAENFMMHLMVENADEWWEHIRNLGLAEKYSLGMAKPPALQPWGLRVLYLTDPTGVLWHIADRRASSDQ